MDPPMVTVTHHLNGGPASSTTPRPTKMLSSPVPRINLRRAASYNAADRGPLSSSSSRFGFEHLAFASPPPSPGLPLPQQSPRRPRKRSSFGSGLAPRPSRVVRYLLWLACGLLVLYVLGVKTSSSQSSSPSSWRWGDGRSSRARVQHVLGWAAAGSSLGAGGSWTLSRPSSSSFSLSQHKQQHPQQQQPPSQRQQQQQQQQLAQQQPQQDQAPPPREWELIGQDSLPDFPTPVIVTDRHGHAKWTVAIPPSAPFPLSPAQYADMWAMCGQVSARVHELHGHGALGMSPLTMHLGGDDDDGDGSRQGRGTTTTATTTTTTKMTDKHFLQVHDAETQTLLGSSPALAAAAAAAAYHRKPSGASAKIDRLGVDGQSLSARAVCRASLTYVLESPTDAGLGHALMGLWLAYGVAEREGRAFFVDDSRWAYGRWEDMFAAVPPPATGRCRQPERHEMVPCPRQATHLVVSAGMAAEVLGFAEGAESSASASASASAMESVSNVFGSKNSKNSKHNREMFALARRGYEALFHLTPPDKEYVFARVAEHKAKTDAVEGSEHRGRIVGLHVRRGDRHPLEFQYAASYIPLMAYAGAAEELLNASVAADPVARQRSLFVVASDDPLVYGAEEVVGLGSTVRAQEMIQLAGKADHDDDDKSDEQQDQTVKKKKKKKNTKSKAKSEHDRLFMHKFEEETFGWEGGFFGAMFWNLGGGGRGSGSSPSEDTVRLRSLIGRAYMMDLAVLADMTSEPGGGIVCAVSAMGCRLLAVMMGEERAFERGEWHNVDGGYGWSAFV